MHPDLPIPSFGYDPHQETPLLRTDVSSSVVESAPGSGYSSSETEPGSDPKRQKIDEDDGGKSRDVVKGSGGEEDEEEEWSETIRKPPIICPETEEGKDQLMPFYEQVLASEGFDYVQVPPVDIIEFGVVHVNMRSRSWREVVEACVDHVVKDVNAAADGVLQLVAGEIVKANRRACQGCNFFITFKATNLLSADPNHAEKEYEAQVYRNFTGKHETPLFRVKGEKKAIREHPARWRIFMHPDCDCDGPCECK